MAFEQVGSLDDLIEGRLAGCWLWIEPAEKHVLYLWHEAGVQIYSRGVVVDPEHLGDLAPRFLACECLLHIDEYLVIDFEPLIVFRGKVETEFSLSSADRNLVVKVAEVLELDLLSRLKERQNRADDAHGDPNFPAPLFVDLFAHVVNGLSLDIVKSFIHWLCPIDIHLNLRRFLAECYLRALLTHRTSLLDPRCNSV